MELSPGYKQTEIGVIPDDWEVTSLGELGEFKNGINKSKEDFGHGFPFINLMDVFGIPRVSTLTLDLGLVNSTPAEKKLYELKKGDVLFVRSSVKPEGVGLTTLIPEDLPDTVFSGFLIRYRERGHLSLAYKEHCFWQNGFRSRVISNSTVSANTNINQDALKRLQLCFPPNPTEQHAISEALSDVASLIRTLENLIAKKRDIKQATMQQLLTGKRRIKGFQGEWQLRRLGEVAHIRTGKKNNDDKETDGIYPLFVRSQTVERINSYSYDCEAILVPGEGGIGSIFHYINGKFDCHQRVYKISAFREDTFGKFIFYYMTYGFHKQATRNSVKATVDSLRLPTFKEFEFLAPCFAEQIAIAEVLGDMDAEIEALEQRRDKTRALKQGMMQELLTGRIRLV